MNEINLPNETCEKEGHDFEIYAFQVGSPYDNYFEQAGYCNRCGFDTHEEQVTPSIKLLSNEEEAYKINLNGKISTFSG